MNLFLKCAALALWFVAHLHASTPSKWPMVNQLKAARATTNNDQVAKSPPVTHEPKDFHTKSIAEPTMLHNIAAGSAAGLVEVYTFGHVMSYLVNQTIQKNKLSLQPANWAKEGFISLHPRDMLRGIHVTAAGMAPVTAAQVALAAQGQEIIRSMKHSENLSDTEKALASVGAGAAAAAAFATTQERIPNYMQTVAKNEKRTITVPQAVAELAGQYHYDRFNFRRFRSLWRGVTPTMWRDGGFSEGFIEGPKLIIPHFKSMMGDNKPAEIVGATVAGVATAGATQPMHVIARYMQNNMHIKHMFAAMAEIVQKDGILGLWAGGVPRGLRVTGAVPTYFFVTQFVLNRLQNNSPKK